MPTTYSKTNDIPYLIGYHSHSLCTPPVDARTVRELLFATLETEIVGLEMHKPSDVIFEHNKSYFHVLGSGEHSTTTATAFDSG